MVSCVQHFHHKTQQEQLRHAAFSCATCLQCQSSVESESGNVVMVKKKELSSHAAVSFRTQHMKQQKGCGARGKRKWKWKGGEE